MSVTTPLENVVAEAKTLEEAAAAGAPAAAAAEAAKQPDVTKVVKDTFDVLAGRPVAPQEFVYDVKQGFTEAKAGYKTTEFWLSGAVIVLAQIGALDLPGKYGKTITTGAAAVAYILSRGFAKSGVPSPK